MRQMQKYTEIMKRQQLTFYNGIEINPKARMCFHTNYVRTAIDVKLAHRFNKTIRHLHINRMYTLSRSNSRTVQPL